LEIKCWSKNLKKQLSHKLDVLEEELQILYQTTLTDWKNIGISDLIKIKESERMNILKAEEDA
jgi:hypothetical protein